MQITHDQLTVLYAHWLSRGDLQHHQSAYSEHRLTRTGFSAGMHVGLLVNVPAAAVLVGLAWRQLRGAEEASGGGGRGGGRAGGYILSSEVARW